MKLELTKSQLELLQEGLAELFVDGKLDEEQSPGSIKPSWYRKIKLLARSIEKQTGINNEVKNCWP